MDIDEIDRVIQRALQVLEIEQEVPLLEDFEEPENLEVIIGKSENMLEVFKMIGLLGQNRALRADSGRNRYWQRINSQNDSS